MASQSSDCLGGADAARGFEADRHAGALSVLADGAHHGERDGQSGVDGFLAGRGLDEVGAGHHRHPTGARDVAQGHQVAGAEDGFHVHGAAGVLEGSDFVIKSVPVAVEDVGAGDDDVDLRGASFDGAANLLDALGERREAGGESGGNGGDRNAGALERFDGGFDKGVIDADRADGEVQLFNAEGLDELALKRIARLGAETLDALGGIVAAEGGQIHAGDGAEQPRGLIFFFDGAARGVGLRSALDGAGVDADFLDPVEIEGNAAIGFQRTPVEGDGSGCGVGRDGLRRHGGTAD